MANDPHPDPATTEVPAPSHRASPSQVSPGKERALIAFARPMPEFHAFGVSDADGALDADGCADPAWNYELSPPPRQPLLPIPAEAVVIGLIVLVGYLNAFWQLSG